SKIHLLLIQKNTARINRLMHDIGILLINGFGRVDIVEQPQCHRIPSRPKVVGGVAPAYSSFSAFVSVFLAVVFFGAVTGFGSPLSTTSVGYSPLRRNAARRRSSGK